MRFRCKVCRCRVNFHPSFSRDNRRIFFRCPNCLASGSFRNKDFVPPLFVKHIRLASRQYVGVLSSSQLRLGGARLGLKPPINVLDSAEHRYKPKPKYS